MHHQCYILLPKPCWPPLAQRSRKPVKPYTSTRQLCQQVICLFNTWPSLRACWLLSVSRKKISLLVVDEAWKPQRQNIKEHFSWQIFYIFQILTQEQWLCGSGSTWGGAGWRSCGPGHDPLCSAGPQTALCPTGPPTPLRCPSGWPRVPRTNRWGAGAGLCGLAPGGGLAMVLVSGAAGPVGPVGQGWGPTGAPRAPWAQPPQWKRLTGMTRRRCQWKSEVLRWKRLTGMTQRRCQWKSEAPYAFTLSKFELWAWLLAKMQGFLIVPCLYQGQQKCQDKWNPLLTILFCIRNRHYFIPGCGA